VDHGELDPRRRERRDERARAIVRVRRPHEDVAERIEERHVVRRRVGSGLELRALDREPGLLGQSDDERPQLLGGEPRLRARDAQRSANRPVGSAEGGRERGLEAELGTGSCERREQPVELLAGREEARLARRDRDAGGGPDLQRVRGEPFGDRPGRGAAEQTEALAVEDLDGSLGDVGELR
jgi:hypothetical protein